MYARSITHPVVYREGDGVVVKEDYTQYRVFFFFTRAYNTPIVCYYDDDDGGQNIDVYYIYISSPFPRVCA